MKKQLLLFGIITIMMASRSQLVLAADLQDAGGNLRMKAVASVEDYIEVHTTPAEDSASLGKLYDNNFALVVSHEDGWCLINSGSVFGYVPEEALVIGDKEAVENAKVRVASITADRVRVRMEPSEEGAVEGYVSDGQQFILADEETEGWTAIEYGDDTCYVAEEYTEISEDYTYAETIAEERARLAKEKNGINVVEFARQFIGNPYRWGGVSLTDGADCSGFVMAVYANFGVSLPHSSRELRSCGYEVSYEDALPGDIICYDGHVAIYAGDGMIVHAFNSRAGIVESDAEYKSMICVRRIF